MENRNKFEQLWVLYLPASHHSKMSPFRASDMATFQSRIPLSQILLSKMSPSVQDDPKTPLMKTGNPLPVRQFLL
jgi:hypothetical protein